MSDEIICQYDRADRWQSISSLEDAECTHIISVGGAECGVDVFAYVGTECRRPAGRLGETCGKIGEPRLWIICRTALSSSRRQMDWMQVECTVRSLHSHLVLFETTEGYQDEVTIGPVFVAPPFGLGRSVAELGKWSVDDDSIPLRIQPSDTFRFAKLEVLACITSDRKRTTTRIVGVVEVTCPPE